MAGEREWAERLIERLQAGHYLLRGEFESAVELMGPENS
jgi:hypothetical protein